LLKTTYTGNFIPSKCTTFLKKSSPVQSPDASNHLDHICFKNINELI